MIADMLGNKTLNPIATELFLRGRKLNILFLSHSFILLYQINIRLNSTHYFTMKIPNKQELQQYLIIPQIMMNVVLQNYILF